MAPTLHSPKVTITWTNIVTDGVDRDIVAWNGSSLHLYFGLYADTSLFGKGSTFRADFRVIDVDNGLTHHLYWDGGLDGLKPYAPSMWLVKTFARADWAGVRRSQYDMFGTSQGDGLYLFRPYFLIQALDQSTGELWTPRGWSEFAVAEEHYFVLESSGA